MRGVDGYTHRIGQRLNCPVMLYFSHAISGSLKPGSGTDVYHSTKIVRLLKSLVDVPRR
jgi:hypothetical protein